MKYRGPTAAQNAPLWEFAQSLDSEKLAMYLSRSLWSPQTGSDLTGAWRRDASMLPSSRNRYAARWFARKAHRGVLGDNSAATAKWRWTCSHVADAAPEWPALLAATTTATLMLRADPCYPTVALFHVSLTLRKI